MFKFLFQPYGYVTEGEWWDICIAMYDEDAPTHGEYIRTAYKWVIHKDILWENDCSYSSRKDGDISTITPYQFNFEPIGVKWENQPTLGEFMRQLKYLTPYEHQWVFTPFKSFLHNYRWNIQPMIDRWLNNNWWNIPQYPRNRSIWKAGGTYVRPAVEMDVREEYSNSFF